MNNIMWNNVRKKSNRQPKGDFSFIKDEDSRKALHNLYIAVTVTKQWGWLKTFEPDKKKGFMFTSHPNLSLISNTLDDTDPVNGHSGASWGCFMGNMSHIASFGWDNYVARYKKRYPDSVVVPTDNKKD